MKHTPGPWEVHNRLDIHADHFGTCVAHCYNRIKTKGACDALRSESEANAILIAAAPELLKALEQYVAHFGDPLKVAAAAIRKATEGQ